MPEATWRAGVIDSGSAPGMSVRAARRFYGAAHGVMAGETVPDASGHGTAVARILLEAGGVELVVAQVLDEHCRSTPAAVAAGIDWARQAGVQLLHLSLGLAADREVLRHALQRAVAAGVIVVAAAPARGMCTWPAAYPGVIRASGDARCAPGEISYIGSERVGFGGCPAYAETGGRTLGGASIGAAHVAAWLLKRGAPDLDPAAAVRLLIQGARYHGSERRGVPGAPAERRSALR